MQEHLEKEISHLKELFKVSEETHKTEIRLASTEVSRRLEILNGEAGRLREIQATYLPREVAENQHKDLIIRLDILKEAGSEYLKREEVDKTISRMEEDIKLLQLSKATLEGKASQLSVNILFAFSLVNLTIEAVKIFFGR